MESGSLRYNPILWQINCQAKREHSMYNYYLRAFGLVADGATSRHSHKLRTFCCCNNFSSDIGRGTRDSRQARSRAVGSRSVSIGTTAQTGTGNMLPQTTDGTTKAQFERVRYSS